MTIADLMLISIGLAMDAFAVSVCKGLSMKKLDLKGGIITALFFGVFQGVMPMIGYFLGTRFANLISSFSHWVSFGLLAFIGGKMIFEAVSGDTEEEGGKEYKLDLKELTLLAIATSIDALAVGISFACVGFQWSYVIIIALVSSLATIIGLGIGIKAGQRIPFPVEPLGGIVLIGIGVKILIEHLS